MKKKKIEAQPIRTTKKNGRIICAQVYEDILICDLYNNKKYLARYAITSTGEHATLKNGKWSNHNMQKAFGFGYYEYNFESKLKFDSEQDQKTVKVFTQSVLDKEQHLIQAIPSLEREYNREVRENAYQRKVRRIEELMSQVPQTPDDFMEVIEKRAFKASDYWMWDKEKAVYHCTACGKTHKNKNAKHNMTCKCSRTDKDVVVKKKNPKGIIETTRAGLIQKLESGRRVARHFIYERVTEPDAKVERNMYEEVRVFFGSYEINKKRELLELYYGQYNCADEFRQDWWTSNQKNKYMGKEYLYPDAAVEGSEYDRLGLQEIAQKGWYVDVNRMMRSNWKPFEYLVKNDLENLTRECSEHVGIWSGDILGVKDVLNLHGDNMKEILKLDGQRIHRLKQINGGVAALGWLQLEATTGGKIKDEVIKYYGDYGIESDDIRPLTKYMSPEKIKNHLQKQRDKPKRAVEYWLDYMSMAKKLGYDLSDEIVYKPKDIKARHDEFQDMINRMNTEEEAMRLEKKFSNVSKVLKNIKKIYEYKNENYVFKIPETVLDIMVEGKNLHTCVASSDRYLDRINTEETYIGFVRKKEAPDNSYYTIEFEPCGTVRQKRSEYNRQPELEEIVSFLKEWQQAIKDKLPKKQKEKQKKSELLRQMGMDELRKTSPEFAKTLEDDLLAV